MPNHAVKRLVQIHNGVCHYCNRKTNFKKNHPRQATREHVVPRSFGGPNSLSNYVLACLECNNDRGTALFYCKCATCEMMISAALMSNDTIDLIFEGILRHNRAKVFYHVHLNKWTVRIGHNTKNYHTWEEAMAAANTGFPDKRSYT